MSKNPPHDADKIFGSFLSEGWKMLEIEGGEGELIQDEIREIPSRYDAQQEIGHGGMKRIYRTDDYLMKRTVAQAFLLNGDDKQQVERFFREARLTGMLQHPNIVPLYDMGFNENGQPYFTMRLIHGDHLGVLIQDLHDGKKKMSLPALMEIYLKICDAIAFAHSNDIIHLDLKPENIHLGRFGQVLVCDWGLAKQVDAPEEMAAAMLGAQELSEVTRFGQVKGSPGYMAPEQISNAHGMKGKRTDIYALGALLYALLCHRAPIKADDFSELLERTEKGRIPLPSRIMPSVPEGLEAVAMKALSTAQDERYSSVGELQADIRRWIEGFATSAENQNVFKVTILLIRRHRTLFTMLLLLFISISVFAIQLLDKKREAEEALTLYKREQVAKEDALRQKHEVELEKRIEERWAAQRDYQVASTAALNLKFDEALQLLEKAVQRDPTFEKALLLKVQVHFARMEYDQCRETLERVSEDSQLRKSLMNVLNGVKVQPGVSIPFDQLRDLADSLPGGEPRRMIVNYCIVHADNFSLSQREVLCRIALKDKNRQLNPDKMIAEFKGDALYVSLAGVKEMSDPMALQMLPITHLDLSGTRIRGIEHVAKMALIELDISDTWIQNYWPLSQIKTLQKLVVGQDVSFPWAQLELDTEIVFK